MTDTSPDKAVEPHVDVAPGAEDLGWRTDAIHALAGFGLAFVVMLASDVALLAALVAAVGAGLVIGWRLPGNSLDAPTATPAGRAGPRRARVRRPVHGGRSASR